MSQDEHTNYAPDAGNDNLAELDGIGERYAAALAQVGIHSFRDLIKYTPKTLSEVLKAQAGVKISEKRIDTENWIGQARQALGRKNLPVLDVSTSEETLEEEAENWEERGTFQVIFEVRQPNGEAIWQTRVYDDHSGDETPLEGVDPAVWANWILERTGLDVQGESQEKGDEIDRLQHEMDALQAKYEQALTEITQLQQDLEAAGAKTAAATEGQNEALMAEIQTLRANYEEAVRARDQASAEAQSLQSVTQQLQAQLDAAIRSMVSARSGDKMPPSGHAQRPPLPAREARTQAVDQNGTAQPADTIEAETPDLQVNIQDVIFSADSMPATGRILFGIEGRNALRVTHLTASSCVVEIRGVSPQGRASTLLAKLKVPLVPDQFVYEIPFELHIAEAGTYTLLTKLHLTSPGGSATAVHQAAATMVQPPP
ncbi:MAG: hypothetical protein K8L99_16720 [Anaerolineae bacterium]|nr:hypothetical protein [Anaerolineae bacterium]